MHPCNTAMNDKDSKDAEDGNQSGSSQNGGARTCSPNSPVSAVFAVSVSAVPMAKLKLRMVKQQARRKDNGALYCRTSSKANEHGASMPRQKAAGKYEAISHKVPSVRTVCGAISAACCTTYLRSAECMGLKQLGHTGLAPSATAGHV